MTAKVNLLRETIGVLTAHKKTPADVLWVGLPTGKEAVVGSWSAFEAFADFEYDAGCGGANINENLVVVGDDWWLERGEYDGSEWWEFKTLPIKPVSAHPLRRSDLDRERW